MSAKITKLLPYFFIAIYIGLACLKIDLPGLHYDEVFYGNVALGNLDNTFIYSRVFGFPVMLMSYIGALKAYIYFGIFSVFPPSYLSIRLPMILICAFSLLIIFQAVKQALNNKIASFYLLFQVFDPTFIALTRTDFGPVGIAFLCRAICLYCLIKFADTQKRLYLAAIIIFFSFGFYDKLNFIWFISSFTLAGMIFYYRSFQKIGLANLLKGYLAKILILLTGLFFLFMMRKILAHNISGSGEAGRSFMSEHVLTVFNNILTLTNGTIVYDYLIGDWNLFPYLGVLFLSLILIGSLRVGRESSSNKKSFFFFNLTIVILTIFQILLTRSAVSSWHVFMLYPFITILLAISVNEITGSSLEKAKSWQKVVLAALVFIIIGNQLATYRYYLEGYELPYKNISWSKKINELFTFTQSVPNSFVSVDWGIHNQLLVLGHQSNKYIEGAFLFEELNKKPENEIKLSEIILQKNNLFILHTSEKTYFKNTRNHFFALVQKQNAEAILINSIADGSTIVYEIYQIKTN